MFNFFNPKEALSNDTKESTSTLDFSATEALNKTLKNLYKPSYEQIKKDILEAINDGKIKIEYNVACIDNNTKKQLKDEGFSVFEGILLNAQPYFSIKLSKDFF